MYIVVHGSKSFGLVRVMNVKIEYYCRKTVLFTPSLNYDSTRVTTFGRQGR